MRAFFLSREVLAFAQRLALQKTPKSMQKDEKALKTLYTIYKREIGGLYG